MMETSNKGMRGRLRARAASRSAFLTLMGMLLGVTLLAGCAASDAPESEPTPEPAPSQQEAAAPSEQHQLSLVVEGEGEGLPASVGVLVTGKQADGVEVSDRYEAAFGKTYALAYPAGSYTFDFDSTSLEVGDQIFAPGHFTCTFDGSKDQIVRMKLALDVEAMKKVEAEKESAAAAAAEEEAAAQQKADEEAAAAAAAEQEAAAAAAASAGDDRGADTVFITKTGKRYHRDGCSSLSKSKIPSTRSEAEARGLTPCQNCNP